MTRRNLNERAMALLLLFAGAGKKGYSATAEAIAADLMQVADQVFESHHLTISQRCRGWLTRFINDGARQLQAAGADDSSAKKARANVRRFAEEMVKDRMATRGGLMSRPEIDDDAFQKAKAGLCPLYPFC